MRQPLRIRRRLALGLCLCALGLSTPTEGWSQTPATPTVSVSFKDKDIASILDFIAQNSGYKIEYEPELRTAGYKATVSFDEVTPEKAVEGLLKGTPFIFAVDGKTIRIFRPQQQATAKGQVTGSSRTLVAKASSVPASASRARSSAPRRASMAPSPSIPTRPLANSR